MLTDLTDSELGPALMTIRGFQWVYGTRDDPYALLLRAESDDPRVLGRRVREAGGLTWSSAEAWVTADYRLGAELLADPRLDLRYPERHETDDGYSWEIPKLHDVLPLNEAYLAMGRADYERLGALVAAATGGDGRDRSVDEVTGLCRGRLDGRRGTFDLTTDFARDFSTSAVGLLLGLPPDEHERFTSLCTGAATALDATLCPPRLDTTRQLISSIAGLRELAADLVAARRAVPGDDLISRLLAADGATEDDAFAATVLFAVVGVETTTNLICNAVSALLDHPDQLAELRRDPTLAGAAVEETLRFSPPVRLQKLLAQTDVELAGQAVPAGGEVVVLIEAANRDPEVYPDPDRFDLTRRPAEPHLSLRDGLPTGVVATATRRYAGIAVSAIASRLPDIRRADPEIRRLRSPVSGGVLRFPVVTA